MVARECGEGAAADGRPQISRVSLAATSEIGPMQTILLLALCSGVAAYAPGTRPLVIAAARRAPVAVNSIAVFGASGRCGSEVVLQAMERGEKVSCLVRNKMNLEAPRDMERSAAFVNGLKEGSMVGFSASTNDNMLVTQGTVLNRADVDKVFEGNNVTGVVVAIGGKTRDVGVTLLREGTAQIIAACEAYGVKRVCVVSTVGAGDSIDQAPWAFKLLFATVMKTVMVDKNAQEALFLEGPGKDLDYCILRPGAYTHDTHGHAHVHARASSHLCIACARRRPQVGATVWDCERDRWRGGRHQPCRRGGLLLGCDSGARLPVARASSVHLE